MVLLLGPYHFCSYGAHLCIKCFLSVSNFLEEISSLSHSDVFLYFFALITEEGFFISPCCSLELHSNESIFPFLLCLSLLFFCQVFLSLLGQPFCLLIYTISCREPAWGIPPMAKVMRKEARQNAKAWSGFRVSPWVFLNIYPPKPESAWSSCTVVFHSSDTLWKS